MDIDRLFAKTSIIPVVVKEKGTGRVLSLAYMTKEALRKTMNTGYAWYASRGLRQLYTKTRDGNSQKVYNIRADGDYSSLLIKVYQKGKVCHSGHGSCFYRTVWNSDEAVKNGHSVTEIDSNGNTHSAGGHHDGDSF